MTAGPARSTSEETLRHGARGCAWSRDTGSLLSCFFIQRVVCGPAASTSPGGWLERQNLGHLPRLLDAECAWEQEVRVVLMHINSETLRVTPALPGTATPIRVFPIFNMRIRDTWLALSAECTTLDLIVVSSSPTLSVEIT